MVAPATVAMSDADFYESLASAPVDTIDISGRVLVNKTNNQWHVCQKNASHVGRLCGSGAPPNPNDTSGYTDDYYEQRFNRACDVVSVKESLEFDNICSNCQRAMENEYDLNRMIIAVPADPEPDETKGLVERFVRRLSES